MISKPETIRRVIAKMTADKAARDKMLRKSFRKPDSFEGKSRIMLAQKYARLIRDSEKRLSKLRS